MKYKLDEQQRDLLQGVRRRGLGTDFTECAVFDGFGL
jgi:hypothetical protein